jgi:2-phosphosulfolactate phosphatase
VAGKTVVLTTSNGTRALHAARHSDLVLAVCLNNLTRSAALLLSQAHRKIVILAAGESGSPAEEDTLTAGLLLDRLVKAADRHKKKLVWDAAAGHILDFCRVIEASHCQEKFLQNAPHGRDLVRLGFQKDIRFAARLDVINLVGMATVSGIRVARV